MYKVLLRNNETREERWHVEPDGEWGSSHEFLWTEGNYACDDNRERFFKRAGGEPERDFIPCGDDHYTAICAELADGTRVTLDDEISPRG